MGIWVNGKKVAGVGKPGKSAYQAAADGGYTGTEADFNSSLAKIDDIFSYVPDVSDQISEHNADDSAHHDIRAELAGKEQAGAAANVQSNLDTHTADKHNPHATTAEQVGADPEGSAAQALVDAKSYTDQKISEIPAPDVSGQIAAHNASGEAHQDIRTELAKKETAGAANRALEDAKAYTDEKLGNIQAEDEIFVIPVVTPETFGVSTTTLSKEEIISALDAGKKIIFEVSVENIKGYKYPCYPFLTVNYTELGMGDGYYISASTTDFSTLLGLVASSEGMEVSVLKQSPYKADFIDYNNKTSGLTAKNVQDAIDELNTKIYTEIGAALEASY